MLAIFRHAGALGAPAASPMRVLSLATVLAFAAASFATDAADAQDLGGETVTVETASGQQSVPHDPQTIVVYDLASLDTLDALGVDVTAAPTAPYPDYLSKYAGDDVEKVGSLFEADLEAVAALEPDLIITGGRSASQTEAPSEGAPPVDRTVGPDDFLDSARPRARAPGTIFDKQALVDQRIARLTSSIAEVKTRAARQGKGLIVLTTGNRMSAFGPGSRFGILHGAFRVAPADTGLDTSNHGEAISFEYIARTNPDWLFVIDRDAAIGQGSAAAMLENELVENTKAWKAGHVVYLDPATWYLSSAGLTALQRNVDQLSEAFAKAE